MPIDLNRKKTIDLIESVLKNQRIIVYNLNDGLLLQLVLSRKTFDQDYVIWTNLNIVFDKSLVVVLNDEGMDIVMEYHYLYDFSDKVVFMTETSCYGDLFNYVASGILTKQEMVDALLYNI